ncbi:unnamed protein product [Echinostoma caproni]|uniref:Ribosomal_L6 domain-containing protein n=1 Tax=Echinostoma caproni TaxID=27848 RepID=A0A183AKA8_9TREM|nr:unnamed protein product [Echinostoma caproni]
MIAKFVVPITSQTHKYCKRDNIRAGWQTALGRATPSEMIIPTIRWDQRLCVEAKGLLVVAEALRVLAKGMWVKAKGMWVLPKELRVEAKELRVEARGLRVEAKGLRVEAKRLRVSAKSPMHSQTSETMYTHRALKSMLAITELQVSNSPRSKSGVWPHWVSPELEFELPDHTIPTTTGTQTFMVSADELKQEKPAFFVNTRFN